ncbi:hypothetical protein [Porphyromonas sp.]|uniref:hypothetical protein n=1 Tax=Porphyromonas sp. TaxID=1924944 RepID=UPI0026DCCEE2|nr:hypothetical protein [Porphyromonas sp.]MDO4771152.1 hypothetical protein [Porphyromonas sp.]
MKKVFILILLGLAACTSSEEKKANLLISEAESHISEQRYEQALTLLDSLNKSFPTAVKARRQAFDLIRQVRLLQSRRDSLFLAPMIDSLLIREAKALELFEVIKSEEIEGHSITRYKDYNPAESQPQSSFLDVYFNNEGLLEIVAGTSGAPAPESMSVTIKDKASDTFVTSDTIPYDGGTNYRYDIDGRKYERLTFTHANAEELAAFVFNMGGTSKLQVEINGAKEKKRTFDLPTPAIRAIQASYELHRIKTEIQKGKDQLNRHERRNSLYQKEK